MLSENSPKNGKLLWEICGHEAIVNYLKGSIEKGSVSHAYIFAGPESLGKHTVAKKFVQSLYCTGSGEYRPCGECSACRQIEASTHPDFYQLKKVLNEKTGKMYRELIVDQIRELKFKLSQGTLLKSWKVALIDEAESLNENAANSLLKVLEEPSPKTVIILIADDINRLPKTVVSRSVVLNFLPVAKEVMKEYLAAKMPEEKADRAARLALGRPAVAIALSAETEEMIRAEGQMASLSEVIDWPLYERLNKLESLMDFDKDEAKNISGLRELLSHWQIGLRDLMMLKCDLERETVSLKNAKAFAPKAHELSWPRLLNTHKLIIEAKKMIGTNISSKNILENIMINI